MRRVGSSLDHPWTNVALGVVLIAAALLEMFDTAIERWLHHDVGAEYGVLIYGVVVLVKGLKHVGEAVEGVQHVRHRGAHRRGE